MSPGECGPLIGCSVHRTFSSRDQYKAGNPRGVGPGKGLSKSFFCPVLWLNVLHLGAFDPPMLPALRWGQGRLLQHRALPRKRGQFVARWLCPQCSLRFQHSDAEPTSDGPRAPSDDRVTPHSGQGPRQFPPRPPRIYIDRSKTQGTGGLPQFLRSSAGYGPKDDSSSRQRGRPGGRITDGPLSEVDRDVRQVSQVHGSVILSLIG